MNSTPTFARTERPSVVLAKLVGADANVVAGVLATRLTSLRVASRFWSKGDARAAADALSKSGDDSVVADVLVAVLDAGRAGAGAGAGAGGASPSRSPGGGGGETLTLELAAALSPLLPPLLSSPHARHADASMRFAREIVLAYEPLLKDAAAAAAFGGKGGGNARGGIGVDLVGEERAARAGAALRAMRAMRDGVDAIVRGSGELAPRAKELLALIARLGEW